MKYFILLLFLFSIKLFPQSWNVVGDMPNSVAGGQAVVKGSTIYILGGYSSSSNTNLDLIQAYNTQTNSWSSVGKMKFPRADFVADTFSDSVIYFGGISPTSSNSASLEIWNFVSSPYVSQIDSVFMRLYATGHVVNGNLYAFGGIYSGLNSKYLFEYNFDSNKVTYDDSGNFKLQNAAQQMSVVVGDDIYIFGGAQSVLLNSIFVFNTVTKTFSQLPIELERPRAGGAAVIGSDSVIYIIGGYDELHHALSSVAQIDLKKKELEIDNGPPLNFARKDPEVVSYNGSIYVFGGLDQDGQPVTKVEKLNLITGISNQNTSTPQNFELENNYPNPFNPSTQIALKISKTSKVSLDVYNILGTHVKNIITRIFSPGEYKFTWNGTDDKGNSLASGIYIYTLSSDYFTNSKKMVLLK
ncbi:MAG: T9SS type A sorting domain-containing protein [Bacteroidetes bacterium]|nr:T9SS type A sorting domain-containing protein [Bacteroidota bacterium]